MKHKYTLFAGLLMLALMASACTSSTPAVEATQEPVQTVEDLSFAMVTDEAGLGDQGFNDSAWEGMTRAQDDFNAEIKVVESREQAQYVPNFSTLAEGGEDLIVGVGFLLRDAMAEVAPLFPDANFALIDTVVEEPNVASLLFNEHEGSFLVGAIAGLIDDGDGRCRLCGWPGIRPLEEVRGRL